MAIQTTTIAVTGGASAVDVAARDFHRKYITVYAATGSCKVSFGDSDHATTSKTLAEGNLIDLNVINGSRVQYSGADTELQVTTGIGSNTVLTSDKVVLTYDGVTLFYRAASKLHIPIFN